MLTNTIAMRQNINAVENGLYGLGGLLAIGALRHLYGGIFVRAHVAFMDERRGTSKDVPHSDRAVRQPAALRSPSWRVVPKLLKNFYRSLVMQQANQSNDACTSTPILSIVQNKVTALSTDVAQFFGKLHQHVLRDIERLISALPQERQTIFGETFTSRANPKNPLVQIHSKAYRMTRDGFTLLVMGWTGEKALQFKLAWLEAFNKMEEELRGKHQFPTLPPASPLGKSVAPAIAATPMTQEQLDAVRAIIQKRFPVNRDALRAFSVLQHHFRVVSYRQIPQARFEEVIEFAGHLVLPKPKVKKPKALLAPVKIKKSIPPIPLNGTYLIQSYSGDLSIKQLTSDWSLIKSGDRDWMKDYCRYGMPSEMIPEVMQILLHRLKNNI